MPRRLRRLGDPSGVAWRYSSAPPFPGSVRAWEIAAPPIPGGFFRPLPMRAAGLGQDMPIDLTTTGPETGAVSAPSPGGGAQDVSDADATAFSSWWSQLTQIWPAFLETKPEIADHKARWLQIAQDAYAVGDMQTWASAQQHAIDLNSIEQQRADAEARAIKYRDAWNSIKSYLASAGRMLGGGDPSTETGGLGFFGYYKGLGLPPLVLAVGLASAIAAIAYVVTTYYQIRSSLDFDQKLLSDVEAGKISATDAAKLKQAGAPHPGGLPGAVQSLGQLLIWGGIAYFGWQALQASGLLKRR